MAIGTYDLVFDEEANLEIPDSPDLSVATTGQLVSRHGCG
jgi:hypothetical protein